MTIVLNTIGLEATSEQIRTFNTPEAKRFTGPEQYPWLLRKMVSLLFMKKVNKSFEDFAQCWGCTRPLDHKPY